MTDKGISYYHGGPAGLIVILPPIMTGAKSTSQFGGVALMNKIYVTPSIQSALLFAVAHDNPCIYKVIPLSNLEHDPDCKDRGLSFQCDSVKIERAIIPPRQAVEMARIALFS